MVNTITSGAVRTMAVAAVIALCATESPSEMPGLVRVRTLQSLSATPPRVFSNYFNLDTATGEINISRQSNENASGTYWAVRFAGPARDTMKVCQITSRSNSTYNGWYLGVDHTSGVLKMVQSSEDPATLWYLRYLGKHNGYDAYVLQTLTDKGQRDFQFLGLDPRSGRPLLTSNLDETTQWFLWTPSDLPTEP